MKIQLGRRGRRLFLALILGVALPMTACEKKTSDHLEAAGGHAKEAAKELGAATKNAAANTEEAVKNAAADIGHAAGRTMDKAKDAFHGTTETAR